MPERATSQSPGAQLRLLLRAALLDPDDAVAAWRLCRDDLDLADLDPAAQRLLPQLYRNLRAAGVRDPRVDALRDTHRKTWSRNRIRFRELATLVERFRTAGIEVLLLKGAALIPLAYGDFGARPMTDFDVLVRRDQAPLALRLLGEWGWRATLPPVPSVVDYRHAEELVDPSGQRIDLHWSALHECCEVNANDDFWAASEPLEVDRCQARTLCAADLLLHVCMHGARWSSVQPAGWIADAAMLLRARGTQVDWTRFVDQARRRRLVVTVRGALQCLDDCLGIAPPAHVTASLAAAASSLAERIEHAVKVRPRVLIGSLPVLWFDYARLARDPAGKRRAPSFRSYLRCVFRVPPRAALPAQMARRGALRLRGILWPDPDDRRAAGRGVRTSDASVGRGVVRAEAREAAHQTALRDHR